MESKDSIHIVADDGDAPGACVATRRRLIDLGADGAARDELSLTLAHLAACEPCRQAMRDVDRVRLALTSYGTSSREAEPVGGWEAFDARLIAAQEAAARACPPTRSSLPHRWLRTCAAVAAAVLIAIGTFFWGRAAAGGKRPAGEAQTVSSAKIVPLSKAEIASQLGAFGEVDQVFEGRTRWLLLTSGGADVGLEESAASAASPAPRNGSEKIVILRLNVCRGDEVVSTADVAIVAGKTAELRVLTKDGGVLRYRVITSDLDPSKLAFRAELRSGATAAGTSEPQAVLATDLRLRPDAGASAGQLIAPTGSYDVRVTYAPASL
jgi:hypothetical protein